jgi:hypothetical protein
MTAEEYKAFCLRQDVYSHVLDSMQDQATDDLERAIFKGKNGLLEAET